MERLVIAIGKVILNLASWKLWLGIGFVVVVTHLLQVVMFHVGLIISEMAGFGRDVVDAVFDVINTVANAFSKTSHGAEDFFTGHFSRLSHEGDYATRVHLKVPEVLSEMARLKTDIQYLGGMPIKNALSVMLRLMARQRICPTLDYFRTISLSRWIINGLADAVVPGLCESQMPRFVLIIVFLFDGLPVILGWIGTTGVVLWLVFIEGWPLIRCSIKIVFEVIWFIAMELRTHLTKTCHALSNDIVL